jgi:hypothetical protein
LKYLFPQAIGSIFHHLAFKFFNLNVFHVSSIDFLFAFQVLSFTLKVGQLWRYITERNKDE